MASFTVADGDVGVHAKTLAASTADTVTFTGPNLAAVEVISDGVAALYVSVDAAAATVAGSHCYLLPAGAVTSRVITVRTGGTTDLSLISSGTPTYSVQDAS